MINAKAALYIGSNAAEAHPVSMLSLLHTKENGCKVIVVNPRYTCTATKSDQYIRIRSGTDIPFLQWRAKVIEPLFESMPDHVIMQAFADRLGFGQELFKNYKMLSSKFAGKQWGEPQIEDILREINRSVWTIGYTGQIPERLKAHMRMVATFDPKTLKSRGGVDLVTGYDTTGDYYGLPWPCYGTAAIQQPGSLNLYNTSKSVMEGGGNFRANFGVEREGVSLLAGDGSYSKGS